MRFLIPLALVAVLAARGGGVTTGLRKQSANDLGMEDSFNLGSCLSLSRNSLRLWLGGR